jgi:hypothetical protein
LLARGKRAGFPGQTSLSRRYSIEKTREIARIAHPGRLPAHFLMRVQGAVDFTFPSLFRLNISGVLLMNAKILGAVALALVLGACGGKHEEAAKDKAAEAAASVQQAADATKDAAAAAADATKEAAADAADATKEAAADAVDATKEAAADATDATKAAAADAAETVEKAAGDAADAVKK